jgi:putative GTP pyrophosphokinase
MSHLQYPDRKELEAKYISLQAIYTSILEMMQRDLKHNLSFSESTITIKYRVKSFASYYEKLLKRLSSEKKNGQKIPIHDILALRIVCPFLEDLTFVEQFIRSQYRIQDIERKGADYSFKEFGYNSTHFILEIPDTIAHKYPESELKTLEIQICTILQDAWAEVEHELVYKKKMTPLDEPFRRKLAALNANLTLADLIFQEIRDYQEQLHFELEKRRASFLNHLQEQHPDFVPVKGGTSEIDNDNKTNDSPVFTNMDDMLLKALHAHNRKDYSTALQIYSVLLEQNLDKPLQSIVYIHRGMAYFAKARYFEASGDFRKATECQPDSSRAFYHLGIALRVQDDNAGALKSLLRCIELNPYYFEGLFALAKTFFEVGDSPAALEYCEKALRIVPASSAVENFRGLVLSRMKL